MITNNSNSICILQNIRNLPDFSVKKFQPFITKASIYVGRMIVFVVFMKLVFQRIVLIFMSQQKIPFVKFFPIEILFQINNWIFNIFWHLYISVVTDVVNRSTLWRFSKILGHFYLSGASSHGNAADISSLTA